jgi:hypothetical protein
MASFHRVQNGYAWCSIVDVLQTSAVEQFNDTKLQNLVSLFGLAGNLLE